MYFRPSDCWPQCPQCYNLELTTFQSRWHFDILTRSVTDSFCLRIQENWGINLCEWIFECLLSIMTPVHQDMSTSLARTGAVMFSKNFLALIAGLVHVINYDSTPSLNWFSCLSPTCALIMQPSVPCDTFLTLLGFANILSRTNM